MTQFKKILITGGAGFIGSAFTRIAVEKGMHVVVVDALTYAGHRENLEGITGKGSHELIVENICNAEGIAKILKETQPDAVLNFAAESHVDNSISGPGAFIHTNIVGTYTMLEASRQYWNTLPEPRKSAFRYLQVSTDEVYGTLGATGYFTEESKYLPNSPYSASKAAGDMLLRAWFETYGMPTIITNCSNNYGPRQYPEKLIPNMIRCALAGKKLPVYGDGENIRDWIHVEDHSRGVLLALEKGRVGEVYCLGGRAERTNNQVVGEICTILDKRCPLPGGKSYRDQIAYVEDRLGHDRRYAIDDAKAERELGFSRENTFEQGIQSTVEWYLHNTRWCEAVTAKKAA